MPLGGLPLFAGTLAAPLETTGLATDGVRSWKASLIGKPVGCTGFDGTFGVGSGIVSGIVSEVFMFITKRLLASSNVDCSMVLATAEAEDKAELRLPDLPLIRCRIICVAAENWGMYGGRLLELGSLGAASAEAGPGTDCPIDTGSILVESCCEPAVPSSILTSIWSLPSSGIDDMVMSLSSA